MKQTKPRSIRMEQETWENAKELAWRSRVSIAEWFRRLVSAEQRRAEEDVLTGRKS